MKEDFVFQSLDFLIDRLTETTPFRFFCVSVFSKGKECVIATNIQGAIKDFSFPYNYYDRKVNDQPLGTFSCCHTVFTNKDIKFSFSVPIKDGNNRIMATLNVFDDEERVIQKEEREILEKAAQQISICLGYKHQELELNILNNLFTLSNDLIGIHDLQGNFIKINPAFTKTLGWSCQEILESPFYKFLHPEDVGYTRNKVRQMKNGEDIINLTNRYVTKNRGVIWMEWTSTYDKKSQKAHTIGREVTKFVYQKKQLERGELKYKNLFRKIEGILTVHDTSGVLLEINPAGLKALGYKDEDQIIGKNIFDLVAKEDKELIASHIKQLRETDHAISEMTICKENQEKATWYFISNISESDDGEKQVLTNAIDVTEQRKLAQKYKLAKEAAEDAYKIKSEFVANMSHEIRTPLNAIIGFTELSMMTELSDTQKQYLEIINQSSKTLYNIINDILDFSKMNSNKLHFTLEKAAVEETLSEVVDIVSFDAGKKGIELLLDIEDNVPEFIRIDVTRLKQILLNLLSNALKFTEEGEILLYVKKVQEFDNNINTIRFGVKDTGIGIREDKQEEIFKAFSQEDGSITKIYGGTGLGLTLSNKLLSKAKSSLHLISKKGEGSDFYFDLRLQVENTDRQIDLSDIKRVLVVDDNENNRRILRRMLEIKNVEVVEAENGLKALMTILENSAFDVIIMDYHMPIMDGIETIRKIKEINSPEKNEAPFIILYSSSDDESLQHACDELHIENRLVKPIRMQQMYRVLSQLKSKKIEKDATGSLKTPALETPHPLSSLKILVAEDNEVNMFLTKTFLNNLYPEAIIVEAKNGNEALEYYLKESPNIVLMDIQMPQLNGYEAAKMIRQNEKNIEVPIIALTAHSFPGEKEKSIASGMNDFLTKPIKQQKLEEMLNRWLGPAKGK